MSELVSQLVSQLVSSLVSWAPSFCFFNVCIGTVGFAFEGLRVAWIVVQVVSG